MSAVVYGLVSNRRTQLKKRTHRDLFISGCEFILGGRNCYG